MLVNALGVCTDAAAWILHRHLQSLHHLTSIPQNLGITPTDRKKKRVQQSIILVAGSIRVKLVQETKEQQINELTGKQNLQERTFLIGKIYTRVKAHGTTNDLILI